MFLLRKRPANLIRDIGFNLYMLAEVYFGCSASFRAEELTLFARNNIMAILMERIQAVCDGKKNRFFIKRG